MQGMQQQMQGMQINNPQMPQMGQIGQMGQMGGQMPGMGQIGGQMPGAQMPGMGQMGGQMPGAQMPASMPGQMGQMGGQMPGMGQMGGQMPGAQMPGAQMQGQMGVQMPGMAPMMGQGMPGQMNGMQMPGQMNGMQMPGQMNMMGGPSQMPGMPPRHLDVNLGHHGHHHHVANPDLKLVKDADDLIPEYETFYDLMMATCQLLEQRFFNLDQDRSGVVWYGNFERFLALNGCPDGCALRLTFERNDLECDGFMTFTEWLGLCVEATDTDLQFFFSTKQNAHVVAEGTAMIKAKVLSHDESRTFGLSEEEAREFFAENLPTLYADMTKFNIAWSRVYTPEHHAEGYQMTVSDIYYVTYLLMCEVPFGCQVKGHYKNIEAITPPSATLSAISEAFKFLEKDFNKFDTHGDGYIDIFDVSKVVPSRPKPSKVDCFQRFFPLVREVDRDGAKTLSFFEFAYVAYKMSLSGGYKDINKESVSPGGIKRIMLVIASYLSKLGRDISENGLTLAEVEAFFESIGERVRPEVGTYFRDLDSQKTQLAHEHEHLQGAGLNIMDFLTLLYYVASPTGKYHVSMGYDANRRMPHGPLDISRYVIHAPDAPAPAPPAPVEATSPLGRPTRGSPMRNVAQPIPTRTPIQGKFDQSAFKPRALLCTGFYADTYMGDYKNQKVCFKKLSETLTPLSKAKGLLKWQNEVKCMVEHDNIVKIVSHDLTGPTKMMIQEYCENGRLFDVLYKQGRSPDNRTALRLAIEIATAMAAVHAKGIMHRCLTSFNILLTEGWSVRISCFASASDNKTCNLKPEPGCLIWSAPEMGRMGTHPPPTKEMLAKGYDNKVDVFSFAIVMWELFHSTFPYDLALPGADAQKIMTEVVKRNVRPRVNEAVPQSIREIIHKCWERDPALRPSFEAIIGMLNAIDPASLETDGASDASSFLLPSASDSHELEC